MKPTQKCIKKAYTEIRQIQEASNMLTVESAISNAIYKTFGLWDLGLIKCAMNAGYTDLLRVYGAHTYGTNIGLLKAIRYANYDAHRAEVKAFLMSFIPERMHKTNMYKKMLNEELIGH